MTAERPENQKISPAAPDFHCFWGCANWISIIDLLIRLAAETGTMRILRGEGGVGGGSGPYSAWQEKSEIQAE